ncbi:alpha/beta hydrolase [Pontixanthobacter aestiaquae]|uniref:Alpha/beta fold hydrolase n=1 Tax=Pontixanthobacter aestiaquae TaxID=1509367 RepID=A0A844Z5X4_9SPHN|nr:alpha/beta hydrolase [Pontixanthobacter aestiaquae]MDN3646795.1 alpha/beta hydrolase [Pontixanthobacter aestiaquae]MXO82223.1 alpha/beta fold hydrolase [Pontixanthobacter aestiaquae]
MRWLIGAVSVAVIAYLAVAALLYFQQGRMIYPAPQDVVPLPAGFEEVALETADGLTLRSFYKPADEGRPTAVYFHGNGGTLLGSAAATSRLGQKGYGLLLVEYRGYGGNAGEPSEAGFYQDGRAALAFLEARGVQQDQTILIGNSIGGGTATQMATEIQPKALILVAPFTSVPDVASAALPWVPVHLLVRDQFDNTAKMAKIDAPVLVQHGSADTMIPSVHGETLADMAPNGLFQSFDGAGHDLIFDPAPQSAQYVWLTEIDADLSLPQSARE